MSLAKKGLFDGELLGIGCSIADNAIYIVKHANNVHFIGFNLVPKTIQIAREKAEKNQVNIRFEVVNILDDLLKTSTIKQHSYDI
ncbi:unnamed protein product [Adineta ricciae]|uniref:Methyltransferase domain-containing protein n=1 Tax=Adineta ricciae TaxID=249248 RepID=A0A815MES3_ADIRI|nr:unnamed protein product [Adineta ricciae]CAF1418425.1 unnamed protein product [Adineta ricciae]